MLHEYLYKADCLRKHNYNTSNCKNLVEPVDSMKGQILSLLLCSFVLLIKPTVKSSSSWEHLEKPASAFRVFHSGKM